MDDPSQRGDPSRLAAAELKRVIDTLQAQYGVSVVAVVAREGPEVPDSETPVAVWTCPCGAELQGLAHPSCTLRQVLCAQTVLLNAAQIVAFMEDFDHPLAPQAIHRAAEAAERGEEIRPEEALELVKRERAAADAPKPDLKN